MEPLEDKLKQAMARTEPPEGFAQRTLAHIREQTPAEGPPGRLAATLSAWILIPCRRRPAWAGLLGCLVLLGLGLFFGYRQHQAHSETARQEERIRGERASAQLLMALQITGTHLSRVQELLLSAPQKN